MTRQAKARKATGPPLTGRHKRPITALHTRLVKPSITGTAALNPVPDNRTQRPAVGSRSTDRHLPPMGGASSPIVAVAAGPGRTRSPGMRSVAEQSAYRRLLTSNVGVRQEGDNGARLRGPAGCSAGRPSGYVNAEQLTAEEADDCVDHSRSSCGPPVTVIGRWEGCRVGRAGGSVIRG